MKRLFVLLFSLLLCNVSYADTINLHWLNYDGSTYQDSTCVVDSDLILPSTPPTRYGYTFTGWKRANYIPIEYLESTGTQWIDTGYIATNGMVVDAKVKPINGKLRIGSIERQGVKDPNLTRNELGYVSNKYFFEKLNNYQNYYFNAGTSPAVIHFDTTGTKFYVTIDGSVRVDTTTTIFANQTKTVKISYSDYEPEVYSGRYYYVKIRDDNDVLVRDFIPVLDYTGVPCMLDKVTGQFYYNQGTDNFIAGPVINE